MSSGRFLFPFALEFWDWADEGQYVRFRVGAEDCQLISKAWYTPVLESQTVLDLVMLLEQVEFRIEVDKGAEALLRAFMWDQDECCGGCTVL